MPLDPYHLLVALALILVATVAIGLRLIVNAFRMGRKVSAPTRRTGPTASDYYVRTLQQAGEMVGGQENLAAALNVSSEALDRWLGGEESPPIEVHLAALDLVTRQTSTPSKSKNARAP